MKECNPEPRALVQLDEAVNPSIPIAQETARTVPLLDQTLLLSLPLVGSIGLLFYERGYLSRFGVDAELIEFSTKSIATVAWLAVLALVLLLVYLHYCIRLVYEGGRWGRAAVYASPIAILFFLFIAPIHSIRAGFLSASTIFVVTSIANYFHQREGKAWNTMMSDGQVKPKSATTWAKGSIASIAAGFAGLAVAVSVIGLIAGRLTANNQDTFMVNADRPNQILIRRYGDTYVFRTVDEAGTNLLGPTVLLKIEEGEPLQLFYIHLPHLTSTQPRVQRAVDWTEYRSSILGSPSSTDAPQTNAARNLTTEPTKKKSN